MLKKLILPVLCIFLLPRALMSMDCKDKGVLASGVAIASDFKERDIDQELIIACKSKDLKKARELLILGANVDAQDNDKTIFNVKTPLYCAVNKGHKQMVELLLEFNASFVPSKDAFANLLRACYWKKEGLAILELVLHHDSSIVNAQDEEGATLLHCVANSDHLVEHLALDGPCVLTPVQQRNPYHDIGYIDSKISRKEIAEIFLRHDASCNIQDKKGMTPLHRAVLLHEYEVVKLLLDHHAAVDIQDTYGRTPLHLALFLMFPKRIVKLLLRYNASVAIRTHDGWPPIWRAARCDEASTKLLLQRGAVIDDMLDNHGLTILHYVIDSRIQGSKKGYRVADSVKFIMSKMFFSPHVALLTPDTRPNLQQLSLRRLFTRFDTIHNAELKKRIIHGLTNYLAVHQDGNDLFAMVADQAPLALQQAIVDVCSHQSGENNSTIQLLLAAHGERHMSKIKDTVVQRLNSKKVNDADIKWKSDLKKVYESIMHAQTLSDFKPQLQRDSIHMLKEKLGIHSAPLMHPNLLGASRLYEALKLRSADHKRLL